MTTRLYSSGGGIGWLAASAIGPQICFAPEDGQGGGTGGQGGGEGGGGQGGGAAGQGGDGGQGGGEFYRPEGLPEHMIGKDQNETMDKIFGAFDGYRRDAAERGTVPKELDAYKFELSDKAKPVIQIGDDDKVVPVLRQLAQKHKLTDKQFGPFMSEFFDQVVDLGIIDKPVDPNQLLQQLAPADFKGTPAEMQAKGTERLTTAQNWIKGLSSEHGYDAEMKDELALLTTSPAGVRILEGLMKGGIQGTVNPGGGGSQPGAVTADSLRQRQADPRNDRMSDKFDRSFAEETDRLYKQLYPR